MKSSLLVRVLSVFILLVAVGGTALAQEPADGGPAPAIAPTAIPLDGGVSLLLAGGVAYGLKHLRNRRKRA